MKLLSFTSIIVLSTFLYACSAERKKQVEKKENTDYFYKSHEKMDLERVSRAEYYTVEDWNADFMEKKATWSIKDDELVERIVKEIEMANDPKKIKERDWEIIYIIGRGPDFTFKTDGKVIAAIDENKFYTLPNGDILKRYFGKK